MSWWRWLLNPHYKGLRHELRPHLGVVLALVVVATYWLGHTRPVRVASNAMWDAVEVSAARAESALLPRSGFANDVLVLQITSDDYRELFKETSPLDKAQLARMIATILHAGAEKLIVDIDTSAGRFADLPRHVGFYLRCLEGCDPKQADAVLASRGESLHEDYEVDYRDTLARVVWARAADPPQVDDDAFRPWPVLARASAPYQSAVVMLRADDDGRLRRVVPRLRVEKHAEAAMVVHGIPGPNDPKAAEAFAHKWGESEEVRLLFARHLARLDVGEAGAFIERPVSLVGKTVFLGGDYSPADWFYMADAREHPGVRVVAAAALALANGDVVREPGEAAGFGIELLFALAVAGLNIWIRPVVALTLVAGIASLGALVAAHLLIAIPFVLNVAGILAALGIHQLVEATMHAERGT